MLDLQGYNKGKRVFYRSKLWFADAFDYLENKNIEVDKVDVQYYTDDGLNAMPMDDCEVTSIKDAQIWINYVMGKTIRKEWKGVRYD